MAPVIEAVSLSKKFRLGAQRREDSFREFLIQSARASLSALRFSSKNGTSTADWMWALQDLNFEVQPGEVVGIIGSNGAGKSTLLKILSRITDPTDGYVRLRGRVASLLEVGTGFHPDLTGRENIYLNGVMLGMTKSEVESKFDEIVAFAELEKFLDTPVKRYSSGMYVRLGFAVAAHLDPEILIVDEVLAVGDMAFQKKCLGKMGEFGESGRTILFVSHNLRAILNLCQRGIVLEKGRLTFDSDAKSAAEHYAHAVAGEKSESRASSFDLRDVRGRASHFKTWLHKLDIFVEGGMPFSGELPVGGAMCFHIELELPSATANFDARINFVDLYGQIIFTARSSYEPNRDWGERSGIQKIICEIPRLPLTPGDYRIDVTLVTDDRCVDYVEAACRLRVVDFDYYGTGRIPSLGFFVNDQRWRLG
jgi:lipopolysaccharide transport system ATP-binding protein